MQKTPSMSAMLRDHELSPMVFFATPGIAQQVKGALKKFTKYFKTHKAFALSTIALAYNVSYQALEDPNTRNAVHAATDVLASQADDIAELFLDCESDDIPEEINGIQNEAQRLFEDQDIPEEEQDRPVEVQKGQLLSHCLLVLKEKQPNQTCVGHMQKLFSFLIRHDPNAVLKYFQTHAQQKQLVLASLHFGSISTMVSQLLTCEDKTKQYLYEGLKQQLLNQSLQLLFKHIQDEMYFDGAMNLFEEVLNTTKQSYYQYFQDFKRIANILVSKQTLGRFRQYLNPQKPAAFRNSSKFLDFLFERINSERQDNSYYNRSEETQPPSMQFQVQVFYDGLSQLIETVGSIISLSLKACLFFAGSQFQQLGGKNIEMQTVLSQQKSTGVYKGKLYSLVINLLSKASEEQVQQFLAVHPNIYTDHFQAIKAANYSNTKTYNKNESAAFDLSLIDQIGKKNSNMFEPATQAIGKDLKRMCKKYQTKKFSFQKDSSMNDDSDNQGGRSELPSNFAFNLGGKGNMSIPILSLPKGNSWQSKREGDSQDRKKVVSEQNVKQIIEEQQVQVLTDKIAKLDLGKAQESLNFNDFQPSTRQREEIHRSSDQNKNSQNQQKSNKKEELIKPPEFSPVRLSSSDSPDSSTSSLNATQQIPVKAAKAKQQKPKSVGQSNQKARFYARHLAIYA